MGFTQDYPNVPDWVANSEEIQNGEMVKYQGNVFQGGFQFPNQAPGVGDPAYNGWRFYDELYDQTPHTPTEQAKVIAYIPTWRKREEFNYANDEMYRYITHGIIAFLQFSEINLGEFEPKSVNDVYAVLSDVVNTGHRNGTRISIALGGAVDYGFLNLMTSIGNNPDNPLLDQAVQNVVNFVNLNNLDGVDLDLECWWDRNGDASKEQGGRPTNQGAHQAGYALTLFAQKLKQAMPDKLISAAIFGNSWFGNNYDPRLADYVDWLGIMTYDLTGSWNASPVGPHTTLFKIRNQESYVEEQQGEWPGGKDKAGNFNNPIFSVEDSLWYWTNPLFITWNGSGQNVPRNKVAGGVPIFGYDFAYGKDPDDLSGQVAPGYKVIRYKDILAQFPDAHTAPNANIKVSGSTPRPSFISASGNYPYAHNIYLETPDTAVTKLNFLKDVGAQGVIIWELSNEVWEEGKSIIKALYRNSGNPETRPALPSNSRPSVPSDILIPFLQIMGSQTTERSGEIAQGRERNGSRLPLMVGPLLLPATEQFFNEAGKPTGKKINGEDANLFIGWWREILEKAKPYDINSPEAPSLIADLKEKVDRLFKELESRIRGEDGWLFVPFYSLISLFKIHIELEGFALQNPPRSESGNGENEQKECERQADEVSNSIQQSTNVLDNARNQWPMMDLGPVDRILGTPTSTEPKPQTPIYLSSSKIDLAKGIKWVDKGRGVNVIKQRIIPRTQFDAEVFTVFEIQSKEGCDMAMDSLIGKDPSPFLSTLFKLLLSGIRIVRLTGDVLHLFGIDIFDNDHTKGLIGDWNYQVGDRFFTYVIAGSNWGRTEELFVFKRNGQIYYQGDLQNERLSKFQEYFNINPLS